jgi:hypothetical protein
LANYLPLHRLLVVEHFGWLLSSLEQPLIKLLVLESPFSQPLLRASTLVVRSPASQLLSIERNHPFVSVKHLIPRDSFFQDH